MPTAVTSDKSGSWVHLSCIPGNTVAPGYYFKNKGRLCFALERANNSIPFRQGHSECPFDTKASEKSSAKFSHNPVLSVLFVQIGKGSSWSTCRLFWSAALEQNGMLTEGQGTTKTSWKLLTDKNLKLMLQEMLFISVPWKHFREKRVI